ncbi:hypothetical protein LCGC14_1943120, partial [marine sediment metagenome]
AVKTEELLRESWLNGMPTQAEMRRNPPGAVDKNTSWQKRTKTGGAVEEPSAPVARKRYLEAQAG